MFLIRILGGWSLIAAVMALVYDMTLWAQGTPQVTSLGGHWLTLAPDLFNSAQQGITQRVHPWLWSPVLTTVLACPAWLGLALLGAGLYALGRKRDQVNVFAN